MFPIIKNKEDFIESIIHKEEMGIINKGDFTVIQYNVETPSTFDSSESLECRGIVFCNSTGKVLRRPLEKFHNVNQRAHTQEGFLDRTRKIVRVSEKLDGTMISPFILNGIIFWGTKRCADEFNEHIKNSGIITDKLERFVLDMLSNEVTPVFEYHDPQFEGTCIVINYSERFIRLLALRDNLTGLYLDVSDNTKDYDIDVLVESNVVFNSFNEAVQTVQLEEKHEGYVLELDDGSRVKLKTFWYCSRHHLIDFFRTSWMMHKLVSEYMLNSNCSITVDSIMLWNPEFDGAGDDVIANMSNIQRESMQNSILSVQSKLITDICTIKIALDKFRTRKELGLSPEFSCKNIAFKCFDESTTEYIREQLLTEMKNKHFISNRNYTRWNQELNNESLY